MKTLAGLPAIAGLALVSRREASSPFPRLARAWELGNALRNGPWDGPLAAVAVARRLDLPARLQHLPARLHDLRRYTEAPAWRALVPVEFVPALASGRRVVVPVEFVPVVARDRRAIVPVEFSAPAAPVPPPRPIVAAASTPAPEPGRAPPLGPLTDFDPFHLDPPLRPVVDIARHRPAPAPVPPVEPPAVSAAEAPRPVPPVEPAAEAPEPATGVVRAGHVSTPAPDLPINDSVTPATADPAAPPRWVRRQRRLVAGALAGIAAVATGSGVGLDLVGGARHTTAAAADPAAYDLNAALAAQRAGRLAEARAGYDSVLIADPQNKLAHYDLGVLDQQEGDPVGAAYQYHQALHTDAHFVPALFNLAVAVTPTDPQQAIGLYRQVITQQPGLASAHRNLSVLLRGAGQTQAADAEAQRAATLAHPAAPTGH